jgi:hypothetical protein
LWPVTPSALVTIANLLAIGEGKIKKEASNGNPLSILQTTYNLNIYENVFI